MTKAKYVMMFHNVKRSDTESPSRPSRSNSSCRNAPMKTFVGFHALSECSYLTSCNSVTYSDS